MFKFLLRKYILWFDPKTKALTDGKPWPLWQKIILDNGKLNEDNKSNPN